MLGAAVPARPIADDAEALVHRVVVVIDTAILDEGRYPFGVDDDVSRQLWAQAAVDELHSQTRSEGDFDRANLLADRGDGGSADDRETADLGGGQRQTRRRQQREDKKQRPHENH